MTRGSSDSSERVRNRTERARDRSTERITDPTAESIAPRAGRGAAILMAGLLVLGTAWVAFMVLAVHLLSTPLSLTASLAVVGGVNSVVGVGLLLASVRTIRRLRLLRPDAESESPEPSKNGLLG